MPVVPDLESSFPVQRTESLQAPSDPPEQHTVVEPCTCGHGPEAHEHYRPGTDCGVCGRTTCGEYRPATSAWRRFLQSVGLNR